MTLSIVTTLYESAPYLAEFHVRVCNTAEKITRDYEIILVNDGSPDNSLDVARSIHLKDNRVRVIDLSRNFGHHKAMMTGLAHARGDLVFLLDSDLEEERELLRTFYEELQRSGADVVFGVQEKRKGRLFERLSGSTHTAFWVGLTGAQFGALSEFDLGVQLTTGGTLSVAGKTFHTLRLSGAGNSVDLVGAISNAGAGSTHDFFIYGNPAGGDSIMLGSQLRDALQGGPGNDRRARHARFGGG
jgi:putative glycosyltransferase